MAYTWSVGHKDYITLKLNETTEDKIRNVLTENLDVGIYAIEKAGEQINVKVKHFDVCIPKTEACGGYKPEDGKWRFYAKFEIMNSGVRDLTSSSEIQLSLSNSKMSYHNHKYANSASRRNLAETSISISRATFTGREEEKIALETIISYSSGGDTLKEAASLGKVAVTLNYFGSTITVKDIDFKSYSDYKSTLDEYYSSGVNVWAIFFAIWFVFHSLFLFLQIRFNITEIIKQKIMEKAQENKEANIVMTKEDHQISEHVVNESGMDKTLKDSMTVSRSNADLLPKLLTNDVSSIRSSCDKPLQKEEESEEICEYGPKDSESIQMESKISSLKKEIEPVQEDPNEENYDSDSPEKESKHLSRIEEKSEDKADSDAISSNIIKDSDHQKKVKFRKLHSKKSARGFKDVLEVQKKDNMSRSYMQHISYDQGDEEMGNQTISDIKRSPGKSSENLVSEDSQSKMKREDILNFEESEESDSQKKNSSGKSIGSGSCEMVVANSTTKLKKKETNKSSFFPTAKKPNEEADSSMTDSRIHDVSGDISQTKEIVPEKEPEELKSTIKKVRSKLSQEHIVEFYPYEEGEGDERVISKTSLERVNTATENKRYKNKSMKFDRKAEEAIFAGPILQKNALMTVKNTQSPRVNQLMKGRREGPPYGLGFGNNPRIQAINDQDKKQRPKKDSEIELNVTSFYDSNSSRIENKKANEDDEANEI